MLLHPLLPKISKATSNTLLAKRTASLYFSSCNRDQNRSQYAPLKIACLKELSYFFSQKIESLHIHQIVHVRALAPTKTNNLSFWLMPINSVGICERTYSLVITRASVAPEVLSLTPLGSEYSGILTALCIRG